MHGSSSPSSKMGLPTSGTDTQSLYAQSRAYMGATAGVKGGAAAWATAMILNLLTFPRGPTQPIAGTLRSCR